ncbi:MAG: 23S rRNA (adenine(2030)-N(6))-methyltransferase RlmJ [Gammaproteobacteria bacterium]|nr:23S rRNA (adenine(2030)-N(6))-methyltransferase RlmJ [Gammaproteobacteria bacterium]
MDVGPWAREKLDCLGNYLEAYTTILRRQRFRGYFYVDAFAGPGSLKLRRERVDDSEQRALLEVAEHASRDTGEGEYISGSPRVALELEQPFTYYIFIELDPSRIEELELLRSEFKWPERIRIRREDCNAYLRRLLERMEGQWRYWRGVVFLDPFGMQVPWETLVALGQTRAVEVFINFPVGMAIQRLLKRSGAFTQREREKLDAYFGTPEWFDLLYRRREDLFGQDSKEKVREAGDVLVRWYRDRLRDAFGYVSDAREVQNTRGAPLYYLIFAGPNRTGARIANHVLKQGARRVA